MAYDWATTSSGRLRPIGTSHRPTSSSHFSSAMHWSSPGAVQKLGATKSCLMLCGVSCARFTESPSTSFIALFVLKLLQLSSTPQHGDEGSNTAWLQCLEIDLQKTAFRVANFFDHFPRSRHLTARYEGTAEVQGRTVETASYHSCCCCARSKTDTQSSFQSRLPTK